MWSKSGLFSPGSCARQWRRVRRIKYQRNAIYNHCLPIHQAVENGPPSGWSIELRPGAAEIYLRRSFEDEDILVVVAQHDPFEEEEVEEEVVVDTEDKEEPNEKEELDDNEEVEDNEEVSVSQSSRAL